MAGCDVEMGAKKVTDLVEYKVEKVEENPL